MTPIMEEAESASTREELLELIRKLDTKRTKDHIARMALQEQLDNAQYETGCSQEMRALLEQRLNTLGDQLTATMVPQALGNYPLSVTERVAWLCQALENTQLDGLRKHQQLKTLLEEQQRLKERLGHYQGGKGALAHLADGLHLETIQDTLKRSREEVRRLRRSILDHTRLRADDFDALDLILDQLTHQITQPPTVTSSTDTNAMQHLVDLIHQCSISYARLHNYWESWSNETDLPNDWRYQHRIDDLIGATTAVGHTLDLLHTAICYKPATECVPAAPPRRDDDFQDPFADE